jgi:hypothetical protein
VREAAREERKHRGKLQSSDHGRGEEVRRAGDHGVLGVLGGGSQLSAALGGRGTVRRSHRRRVRRKVSPADLSAAAKRAGTFMPDLEPKRRMLMNCRSSQAGLTGS